MKIEYVREVADRLGLKDWTISLERGGFDEDYLGRVEPIEGRKRAKVRYADDWEELSPEEQRHIVVHELIHLHFAGVMDMARLDLVKLTSQGEYDLFMAGFVRLMEYGVDGLTDALAPLLPEPEPMPDHPF